ncbi:MAG TPA: hypothetical protein VLU73_18660 [Methylococcaceae bacterium]|nr:hypothetical protein [Methylococcaceae bacterium]
MVGTRYGKVLIIGDGAAASQAARTGRRGPGCGPRAGERRKMRRESGLRNERADGAIHVGRFGDRRREH